MTYQFKLYILCFGIWSCYNNIACILSQLFANDFLTVHHNTLCAGKFYTVQEKTLRCWNRGKFKMQIPFAFYCIVYFVLEIWPLFSIRLMCLRFDFAIWVFLGVQYICDLNSTFKLISPSLLWTVHPCWPFLKVELVVGRRLTVLYFCRTLTYQSDGNQYQ